MTKEEFAKIAAALRTYYPSQNLLPNKAAMELWYMQLQDLEYLVITTSLYKWVALNKWAPTIADIREMAVQVTGNEIPDWDSAYEEVRKNIRMYGYYNVEEGLNHLNGVALEAVKRIGYVNICISDKPEVTRANFRDIYTRLAERQRQENKIPIGVMKAINALTERGKNEAVTMREDTGLPCNAQGDNTKGRN